MTVIAFPKQMSWEPLDAERLRAANIYPATGLATDYLNHFNEAIMLLELVPSMPDCAAELMDWRPKSYVEHFELSNYREKELAVEAYHRSPQVVRRAFDDLVSDLDELMLATIHGLSTAPNDQVVARVAYEACAKLKALVAKAAGLMNGVLQDDDDLMEPPAAQDTIDALMAR